MARVVFDPSVSEPFPLSRTKLELFLECPRCFYLDRRCGISRPDNAYYSLNLAVDALLKKEFDVYRLREEPHPLMTLYGVNGIPLRHADLATWRDSPEGIRILHGPTNLEVFGIVDDLWQLHDGSIAVVDYKATSTPAVITLDDRHGYKRQLEMYQWLLKQKGFTVSGIGYFVFVNALKDKNMFDRLLEFTMQILPHIGSTGWIEDALVAAKECLIGEQPPPSTANCEWCLYRRKAAESEE